MLFFKKPLSKKQYVTDLVDSSVLYRLG